MAKIFFSVSPINTGLAVGPLVKWLPIKIATPAKLDTIWVVYSLFGIGSIRLELPWTHCAQWNFTSSGVGHFTELTGAYNLRNKFVPALDFNYLKKLPQLVALQIFKAHFLVMGNHWTIIFYHIIIKFIMNIFFKTLHLLQKDTNVGSQNFGYQLWCCTRLISCNSTWRKTKCTYFTNTIECSN